MKENIANKLLILCLLAAMAGCKAKKQVVAARPSGPTPAVSTVHTELQRIRAAQLSFNTFSAKAKAKLTIDNNSNDVSLNVRISSDKKIWISVTALLGLEVARAVVTPDSIMMIDRYHGQYFKKPFSYIYKYANTQVNYKTLESFFTGNAVPSLLNDNVVLKPDSGKIIVAGNIEQLLYKLILGPDRRVNQTTLNDDSAARSMQVVNSAFIQTGSKTVPSQIDISSLAGKRKIQMSIHYTKVDLDLPLEFPFSIPEDYKPLN